MPGSVPLSVVVPTRDRERLLERCLDALRRSVSPNDEIIVVDSASRGDGTRRAAEACGARYVRCDRPGTSLARNAGWRAAAHDAIAFVDDDIWVEEGWAEAARDHLARRPDVAFLTGGVAVPEEQAATDLPTAVESNPDPVEFGGVEARPLGISGNLIVRRTALEGIAGFDERLGPGRFLRAAEDKDLFDRLLGAGYRGRFEPGIRARHEQWRTRRQRLRLDFSYGIGAGARLAKLMRVDRARARRVGREVVVRWGFQDLASCIRNRYEFGALAALLRLGGIVVGFVAAAGLPIRSGHFSTPVRGGLRR